MYRIPKDIDLSAAIGQFATQFSVGSHDIQFDLGGVHFRVQSKIALFQHKKPVGEWQPETWPSESFLDLLNIEATAVDVPTDDELVIIFANGVSMHLYDTSDQYESMQIHSNGLDRQWII